MKTDQSGRNSAAIIDNCIVEKQLPQGNFHMDYPSSSLNEPKIIKISFKNISYFS
jgi:hypothetical protein